MSIAIENDNEKAMRSSCFEASAGHASGRVRRPSRLDKTTILLQTAIGVFKIELGLGGCPYIIASSREAGNLGDLGETLQHACHRGTVADI